MNVSLKWLRDYVDVTLPAEELARRLTMAGIEVDGIHHVGASWEHVYVARIDKVEPHPNADRLRLVTASYGSNGADRTLRVVTGAPNINEGDVVPLGLVGTRYRDNHSDPPVERVLQPTTMRGVPSEGMVMSGFELGLNDDHAGIMILPPETQVGLPLAEALGDTVIELDLKGRADCLAMIGVAREVAALTGAEIRVPIPLAAPVRERRQDEPVTIEIEDPALCSRFVGVLLKNVKIGPSPAWMQERLQAADMRPINNVVDITNFVMLEWGQPLHAYDYDSVRGGRLIARPAREGETLLTLAEERPEITLTTDQLVIADGERAVGLAGVIGGADTEVRETTTSILLEAANFKPANIRRTARALLPRPTEASRRFERGIPPEHTMPAALRAAQLMVELAGAEIVGEPGDTYPAQLQRAPIILPPTELKRLLGVDYDSSTIEGVFDRLRFMYQKPDAAVNGGSYVVTPPVWRLDIERPADLVEEVARIDGYHRIPTTLMQGTPPTPVINRELQWEDAVRDVIVAAGFAEVISYAWTSQEKLALVPHASVDDAADAGAKLASLVDSRIAPNVEPVRIDNPSNRDQDVMRTTALPSLLQSLAENLRRQSRDVMLFEIGRIYVRREGQLPEERRVLTAATAALRTGEGLAPVQIDFYFMKAVLEAVLERMGITGQGYIAVQHPAFHPHRTAAVILNHRPEAAGKKPVQVEDVIGVTGEVDAETAQRYDIDQRSSLFCVDLDRLMQHAKDVRTFKALPEYPAVIEDLAFVVRSDLPAERVLTAIQRGGAPLVESVELFDVYQGDRVPEGSRSLAFTVTFRAMDHTLTTEEVAAVRTKVIQFTERQTGGKLRG